jgi:glycosyltransferase involved in cell wall biosynthesis
MSRIMQLYQPTGGGVGRHVRDLAESLAERGHEVILCGPEAPGGMSRLPPRVTHLPLQLDRAISPAEDLGALRRLGSILRRTRPDILHTHSSKAGAVGRIAGVSRPGMPVLYTPHGYAFAGWFTSANHRRAYREIERALMPLTSRVVCVCEAEARLGATLGFKRRIRVVHNGISAVRSGPTDPRMLELRERGPVACVLTQLRPGKGIETLIDATPGVLESQPEAQVAIWGEGPELELLRDRARRRGVAASVHFLGSSQDPLAALRGADVFVHPSLAESFPYVILEAMAVGRAIVASDVGGIGEAIVDGESGLLVAPGADEPLARALIAVLEEPERRGGMGEAARRRMERLFTREGMIDRLIGVYHEISPPETNPQ